MPKRRKDLLKSGDQIHLIITPDFVEIAREFVTYCESNGITVSKAVRMAMRDWLEARKSRDRKIEMLDGRTASMKRMATAYEHDVLREGMR